LADAQSEVFCQLLGLTIPETLFATSDEAIQ
jgi:hypothetical protein